MPTPKRVDAKARVLEHLPNRPELERDAPNVLTVRFPDVSSGWEQWIMLSSDYHWDNPYCDRDLLRRHLDKALERNAMITIFGDWFCAMQGKYDPRKALGDVRPEHNGENYLDLLVSTAAEFYAPYAQNTILISHGNHETAILDRCGTSLLSNLAHRLNSENGA